MALKNTAAKVTAAKVSIVKRATKKAKASWPSRPRDPPMPAAFEPDIEHPPFTAGELSTELDFCENIVQ